MCLLFPFLRFQKLTQRATRLFSSNAVKSNRQFNRTDDDDYASSCCSSTFVVSHRIRQLAGRTNRLQKRPKCISPLIESSNVLAREMFCYHDLWLTWSNLLLRSIHDFVMNLWLTIWSAFHLLLAKSVVQQTLFLSTASNDSRALEIDIQVASMLQTLSLSLGATHVRFWNQSWMFFVYDSSQAQRQKS